MPEANERQALFPARAEIIENAHGTAPGFLCRSDRSTILCLPGVPFEMEAMAQSLSFNGPEFAEGRAAFAAKRKPNFR